MSNEQKPKIENLDQQEEELTAEQAAEAQGGYLNAYNMRTATAATDPQHRALEDDINA
jgi:hypothetical protein